MWVTITLVVVGVWVLKRYFISFVIPRWVWPAIGFSVLFIALLNGKEMLSLAVNEGKAWFPLFKSIIQQIMKSLREFIAFIGRLGD